MHPTLGRPTLGRPTLGRPSRWTRARRARWSGLETAGFLERAVDLAERWRDDKDRLSRETALLGLAIAKADRERHAQLDELYGDMHRFAQRAARQRWWKVPAHKLARIAQRVALTASLAASTTACEACAGTMIVMRTTDLALFDPPRVRLPGEWANDGVAVTVTGLPPRVSLRWEVDGTLREHPDGTQRWVPKDRFDQLRLAVRTDGGVAVTSLRVPQVAGEP